MLRVKHHKSQQLFLYCFQVMSISVRAAVSFFLSPREAVRRFDIRVGWRLTIDAYAGMLARDKKNHDRYTTFLFGKLHARIRLRINGTGKFTYMDG